MARAKNLESLMQKRQRIEAQIEAAKARLRRRERVAQLVDDVGALDLTDDEIRAALLAALDKRAAGGRQGVADV